MKTKPIWEIQCGEVIGAVEASTPAAAFRRIMRRGRIQKAQWGVLARFRQADASRTWETKLWRYQDPEALYRDR